MCVGAVSAASAAGDFVGDVTDDVSGLDPEACLGLTGWRDFYHKVIWLRFRLLGFRGVRLFTRFRTRCPWM